MSGYSKIVDLLRRDAIRELGDQLRLARAQVAGLRENRRICTAQLGVGDWGAIHVDHWCGAETNTFGSGATEIDAVEDLCRNLRSSLGMAA